uniref:Uncharacterized protein n=1 Tax=Phenylobacterium glaciei TaxID=2803784 RepID=A0A974S6Z8_9CAUL|nr:hypothetical protein JKL49_17100 [Phenylobacterium glaciei]
MAATSAAIGEAGFTAAVTKGLEIAQPLSIAAPQTQTSRLVRKGFKRLITKSLGDAFILALVLCHDCVGRKSASAEPARQTWEKTVMSKQPTKTKAAKAKASDTVKTGSGKTKTKAAKSAEPKVKAPRAAPQAPRAEAPKAKSPHRGAASRSAPDDDESAAAAAFGGSVDFAPPSSTPSSGR